MLHRMKFFNEFKGVEKTQHNLPHWNQRDVPIFITWRLDDSLPKSVVEKWRRDREAWVKEHPEPWDDSVKQEYQRRFVMKLEEVLDECHGDCVLERAEVRKVAIDALHFFDGERLTLDCYVVMPNHVHVLLTLKSGEKLEKVMQSIKGFSAREINKITGESGKLWQSDYWDRLVRSEKHLDWVRRYIEKNPETLRAGSYAFWKAE